MPPLKDLVREKLVMYAFIIVGVILLGSAAYYLIESRPPAVTVAPAAANDVSTDVIANGTVTPVENPDLSFQVGGKVTRVNVVVGQRVSAGTLLASLDTSVLSANLAAAQANLAGLQAGPRPVDLAGKQTAVTTAQATLSNEYAKLPSVLVADAGQAEEAVHGTDTLFSVNDYTDYPHPTFHSQNQSAAETAGRERGALVDDMNTWNQSLATLSVASSPSTIDAAINDSINHLTEISAFFSNLSNAANDVSDGSVSASELASISTGRATVNSLIVALNTEKQTLSNDALAITAAQDALSQTQAGSTVQAIQAAQAQVNAAAAALAQAEIIAPFSGTIASVAVKAEDVVTPNTTAVSLLPDGNFEVEVYLSEIDMTKIAVGDTADITLDAYGATTKFPATVASVDKAPTNVNGVPSYKATLVFTQTDSRIATGMSANADIHVGTASSTSSR